MPTGLVRTKNGGQLPPDTPVTTLLCEIQGKCKNKRFTWETKVMDFSFSLVFSCSYAYIWFRVVLYAMFGNSYTLIMYVSHLRLKRSGVNQS